MRRIKLSLIWLFRFLTIYSAPLLLCSLVLITKQKVKDFSMVKSKINLINSKLSFNKKTHVWDI